MNGFWRGWLLVWCLGSGLFSVILALGGLPQTDEGTRAIFWLLGAPEADLFTPTLRFSVAVMGAVSIGWTIATYAGIQAADAMGSRGAPIWRLLMLSVGVWFIVDSLLSVATGFAANVLPNIALLAGFFIPILATGVHKAQPHAA